MTSQVFPFSSVVEFYADARVPSILYIVSMLHALSSSENKSQLNVYSVKHKCNLKSYILLQYVTLLIFMFFIITQHVSLLLTICSPP